MQEDACLAAVKKLKPVTFEFKEEYAALCDDKKEHMGLLAQDLKEVFPQAVSVAEKPTVVSKGGDVLADLHTVDYASLVAPLIGAVKALSAKVEELEAKCK